MLLSVEHSDSDYKVSDTNKYTKKIVVLGGGTGQFNLLGGLSKLNERELITAIPGTWDSGGSSGKLRTELGSIPPGDARQCLIALVDDEESKLELLRISQNRPAVGPLKGHDLLNLLIDELSRIHQGHDRGLDAFRRMFRIRGQVIPSSLTKFDIYTVTQKGKKYYSEAELDERPSEADFNPNDRILRIFPSNPVDANPKAIEAIEEADLIVFSSGSEFGSSLPHLLVNGIPEAIIKSRARLVKVLNLMTEKGQTDGFTASDHIRFFNYYLGDNSRLNYLIVDANGNDPDILEFYAEQGQNPVKLDLEKCHELSPNLEVIQRKLARYLRKDNLLRHDPIKLSETILELE